MKKPVSDYTDIKEVRQLMANAARYNNKEVAIAAFQRLCELEGQKYADPIERNFYAGLAAYEELLSEKNGRKTLASRTRQKLRNKSVMECLTDWAKSKHPTDGFRLLIERGLPELTAEYLVVEYAGRFPQKAAENAARRLIDAGVTLPKTIEP
ncbi:MAG TPA: hypothetical protein VIM02_13715 [Rhizomicrobium sp.]